GFVATGVGRGRSRPPSNLATKNASTTIPVVFMTGADPGKMGLVTNLRQSGGNVTGITFFSEELGTKAVSLLRDLVSGAKTYGLMVNPNNPETPRRSADAAEAAHPLGAHDGGLACGNPSRHRQCIQRAQRATRRGAIARR